jgi:hypothetical protein
MGKGRGGGGKTVKVGRNTGRRTVTLQRRDAQGFPVGAPFRASVPVRGFGRVIPEGERSRRLGSRTSTGRRRRGT